MEISVLIEKAQAGDAYCQKNTDREIWDWFTIL
mgnify:CR=1 FL=1